MRSDRLVQSLAFAGALACAAGAGSMLPRIVDSAGEPYVVFRLDDSDGMRRQRVRLSELRAMSTVADGPGAPLEIAFETETQRWNGPLGSTVDVKAVVDGDPMEFRGILERSDGFGLRYTDVAIEGAPPIVALGTALGALRGLIVDYLWIKVNMMKEKGLFYEVMGDADLITKLQPRFGEVWGFHGHNMAYNISVLTNTPEERWAWVRAGIDLVRDRGLRYNPNDVTLHRELAFWFAHKLDGVADDAHLYYKRAFAREWHYLLGEPPVDVASRLEWIKKVADAPETLEELERSDPKVKELVERLTRDLSGFEKRYTFKTDAEFLHAHGEWEAVKTSNYARLMGIEQQLLKGGTDERSIERAKLFKAFDSTFANPEYKEAVDKFIAFLRRKVLADTYNMDARLMYQFTRDTGPLDWRHPQAHALYWSRKGGQSASLRYAMEENISKVLNNDRVEIQAMQALARSGLMMVDPMSDDNPTRLNDPRWTKIIDRYFHRLYDKYYDKAAVADTFANFYENFMRSAIRTLYRAGDIEGAKEILAKLDRMFGTGGVIPNAQYDKPLELLVHEWTVNEYEMQPEVARSDVFEALRAGFREGLLLGRKEALDASIKFANDVTLYFKHNKYNDFVNKFGEGRMKDLIGDLETSVRDVLRFLLLDRTQPLVDRLIIYTRTPEEQQRQVYDLIREPLGAEFLASPLSRTLTVENVLPEPPGMQAYREMLAREAEAAKSAEDARSADVERK